MKITLLSYTPNPETNIASAARICYDSKLFNFEEKEIIGRIFSSFGKYSPYFSH